jgi:hypothetical protein
MPLFSDLRSDYPLSLTLLERPYAGALKQSYRAGLTSARGIPVPLIRSLLSPKSAACVVVAVYMLSTSGRHSITTVLCPVFQMRDSTQGVHFGSVTVWRACSWTAGQVRSTQVRST